MRPCAAASRVEVLRTTKLLVERPVLVQGKRYVLLRGEPNDLLYEVLDEEKLAPELMSNVPFPSSRQKPCGQDTAKLQKVAPNGESASKLSPKGTSSKNILYTPAKSLRKGITVRRPTTAPNGLTFMVLTPSLDWPSTRTMAARSD